MSLNYPRVCENFFLLGLNCFGIVIKIIFCYFKYCTHGDVEMPKTNNEYWPDITRSANDLQKLQLIISLHALKGSSTNLSA